MLSPLLVGGDGCCCCIEGWSWVGMVVKAVMLVVVGITAIRDGHHCRPSMQVAGW